MTITFTPSWTDDAAGARVVVAAQALALGSLVRGTLDLSGKHGAYVFAGIGRGGITALTNGVNIEIRRSLKAGAILTPLAPWFSALSGTTAAILKTVNNAGGYPIGTSAFVLAGTGTPVADEDYCAWGRVDIPAGGTLLPNLEFLRVSKWVGGSNTLTVDAPCKLAKLDTEVLTNRAEGWWVWCPGGAIYEVIFDYGDDAAGDAVAVVAYAQILDSEVGN